MIGLLEVQAAAFALHSQTHNGMSESHRRVRSVGKKGSVQLFCEGMAGTTRLELATSAVTVQNPTVTT